MAQPASIIYLRDVQPRPGIMTKWEKMRHGKAHWFVECFAEFLGVFFYVYTGIGSSAPWVIGNILNEPGLSSIFQIGFAYALGIVFSFAVCASTSGGHLSPGLTITLVVFRGFPPLKALRYIVAQILGAYVACLLIYVQYHDLIKSAEDVLLQQGRFEEVLFTPNGPAGIFAVYLLPGLSLGRAFLNEFVTDVFINLVIWACLDPSNIVVPPAAHPFIVAFAYAAAVWGFAPAGLATNTARDLGGRFAAMTIYGMAATGGPYAAIPALGNIPATLLAAFLYEVFLTDSDRVVPGARREYIDVHRYHGRSTVPQKRKEDESSMSSSKDRVTYSDSKV